VSSVAAVVVLLCVRRSETVLAARLTLRDVATATEISKAPI
jgi:hypothetical protein